MRETFLHRLAGFFARALAGNAANTLTLILLGVLLLTALLLWPQFNLGRWLDWQGINLTDSW